MSPESQELESFFQKIHEAEAPFQKAATAEGGVGQMDRFFERLSSIDDLVLGDAPLAAPAASSQAGEKPASLLAPDAATTPKAAPAQKPQRQGSRMRIFRSDRLEQDPFGAAAAAHGHSGIGERIMTACKVLAAALLLFGVGLASGWAALSLPEKFGDSIATVSERFHARKNITERAPTRVEFSAPQAAPPAQSAEDAKPISTEAVEAVQAAEPQGAPDSPAAGIELPAAEMFDPGVPDKAESAPAKTSTGGQHRFALQVGACHSPHCVNSYRKLLLPHVKPGSIQVVESGKAAGQEPVQRIRIISLTKDDARKLKQNLAAADARLKGAYLIATSTSPSS